MDVVESGSIIYCSIQSLYTLAKLSRRYIINICWSREALTVKLHAHEMTMHSVLFAIMSLNESVSKVKNFRSQLTLELFSGCGDVCYNICYMTKNSCQEKQAEDQLDY